MRIHQLKPRCMTGVGEPGAGRAASSQACIAVGITSPGSIFNSSKAAMDGDGEDDLIECPGRAAHGRLLCADRHVRPTHRSPRQPRAASARASAAGRASRRASRRPKRRSQRNNPACLSACEITCATPPVFAGDGRPAPEPEAACLVVGSSEAARRRPVISQERAISRLEETPASSTQGAAVPQPSGPPAAIGVPWPSPAILCASTRPSPSGPSQTVWRWRGDAVLLCSARSTP